MPTTTTRQVVHLCIYHHMYKCRLPTCALLHAYVTILAAIRQCSPANTQCSRKVAALLSGTYWEQYGAGGPSHRGLDLLRLPGFANLLLTSAPAPGPQSAQIEVLAVVTETQNHMSKTGGTPSFDVTHAIFYSHMPQTARDTGQCWKQRD